jgi:hypothetical protein
MHLGSYSVKGRAPDSEPVLGPRSPVGLDGGGELHPAAVEERILAGVPQIRQCLVVSALLCGRVQTDLLLVLHPDADPSDDHEAAIRAVLEECEAETIRRIVLIGVERTLPQRDLDDDRTLIWQTHVAEMAGARLPGVGAGADPLPVPAEEVRVDFAGEGSGVGELTWGQREIWQSMTRQGNWLPLGGWKPLDPGTSVADVADELAYLHNRFPSMRTTLRFDELFRPSQELAASGSTRLEVFDAADGAEAADALAEAVSAHYQRMAYDLRAEWPVRMGVVRQGGEATRMAVAMHHLAIDGGGGEIMLRDVAVRATEPPTGLQQLELAQWQTSPAGHRHSDKALRHFAGVLRTMPAPTFPPSADPRRPRWWCAEFESSALSTALAVLADRTGADSARILPALYAIALARVTGVHPVVLRPVVANRFRHQLADVVCHAAQAGLLLVDVADATVEEVIDRAGRAGMNALKHAYFDPDELSTLIDTVARERGADLDIASFVNDRRTAPTPPPPSTPPTEQDFATARATTTFRWSERRNDPVERLFLHIDDAPEGIRLSIEADTRALSPADIERVVRGVEEIAVAAALRSGLGTGVGAG